MKLPIALVLAGLSIVSSVAYGASPEHTTPKSIVASQADALSYCQSNINRMLLR